MDGEGILKRDAQYKTMLTELGAVWGSWQSAEVVRSYGDAEAEYRWIRIEGGVGIADRSERETVILVGEEAIPFLQGMVTGDIYTLAEEGSGQLNAAVDLKGRLVADMRLLHVQEMLMIDLEPGCIEAGVIGHFKKNIINEDAKFIDRSKATGRVGLFGENAGEILDKVGDFSRPIQGLSRYSGAWGEIAGCDVIVQAIPLIGEGLGYDLFFSDEHSKAIWESFSDLRPIGFDALESLRIEAGVPRFGVELDTGVIPLEAMMTEAISFTKGCYLGQEIIARLDSRGTPRHLLRTLILPAGAELPEVGAPVEVDGKVVGEVRSAAFSGVLDAPLALAYIKRKFNDVGSEVKVAQIPATIHELGVL